MAERNYGQIGINLQKIVQRLLANDNLVNLLYYADEDPLSHPVLTEEEKRTKIFNKLIKVVPRIGPKEDESSLVSILIPNGDTNAGNNEFQDVVVLIEIFVPLTAWLIKDSNLRPFAIMGEIQKSLNHKKINGLGQLEGGPFELDFLTEEMGSYKMFFSLVTYE